MRKTLLTAFVCLILPCYLFSQDNVAVKQQPAFQTNSIDTPLVVIKGEEFKRFPSGNFLDAVNGLFPWVFSQAPDANNFLFVVDGYVLQDINGISLNDIEEVSFTRNKLAGTFYPFSRPGIFYITTKKTESHKPVIELNSQYSGIWNKQALIFNPNYYLQPNDPSAINSSANKGGHWLNNQLSMAVGSKKFHLYTSVQIDEAKTPHLYQHFSTKSPGYIDTIDANAFARENNLKTYLNFEYHFNGKLTAGITGNYFRGNVKPDTIQDYSTILYSSYSSGNSNTNSHSPLTSYHLGSFINWTPFQNFRNRISFEYTNNHFTYESITNYKFYEADTLVSAYQNIKQRGADEKRYVLRNQADLEFIARGKFRLGIDLLFSYLYDKSSFTSSFVNTNAGFNWFYFFSKEKFTNLVPQVHFSFANIVSGYAGNAFILNKDVFHFANHPNSNPYAGLTLDVKRLLKFGKTDRLDISFNYSDITQNNSSANWLPKGDYPSQYYSAGQIYGVGALYTPSLELVIFKNKLASVQVNSSFAQNRIAGGVEWSTSQFQRFFLIPQPFGGNGTVYTPVLGNETQTGISCYLTGKLIDKPQRKWMMRLNVLFPHVKYTLANSGVTPPMDFPVDYTAQAGWQNIVQLNGFFLQSNVVFGINRKSYTYVSYSTTQVKEFNEIDLSYLLFGYDLAKSKIPALRNFSAFLQARNLLSSKVAKNYYRYDSYAGVGINMKIN